MALLMVHFKLNLNLKDFSLHKVLQSFVTNASVFSIKICLKVQAFLASSSVEVNPRGDPDGTDD
jgi:hypothetical protein